MLAEPVPEAAVVAEPVPEAVVVAEPGSEAVVVAAPEAEAVVVAETGSEAVVVAEPVSEAVVVAEPPCEAAEAASVWALPELADLQLHSHPAHPGEYSMPYMCNGLRRAQAEPGTRNKKLGPCESVRQAARVHDCCYGLVHLQKEQILCGKGNKVTNN